MHPERALQAAIGITLAFSLLWTIAILIPDNGRSSSVAQNHQFGLVVNGTRYVFYSKVEQDQAQAGENVHIIYAASPATNQRHTLQKLKVLPKTKVKKEQLSQLSSSKTVASTKSSTTSSSQKKEPLFPRYAWFALSIMYHVRRFMKKRQQTYEEDWFVKRIDAGLEYYGAREYEDDFLSVDGSFYGSMSKWNGDESNKFDV